MRVLMAVAAVPLAQGALEFLARTNREEANELVRRLTMSGRRLGACHSKENARPEDNMEAKDKKSLDNTLGPFYLTGNPSIEKLLEENWFIDPVNNPEESNATVEVEGWAVVQTEKGRVGELPDERVVLEVMVIPPSGVVVDNKEQVDNLVKEMTQKLIRDVKELEEKAAGVEAAKKEADAGQGNTAEEMDEDSENTQVMDDPRSDADDENESAEAGKGKGDETNFENTRDATEDPKVEYLTLEVSPEDLPKYRKFARLVSVTFRVTSVDQGVLEEEDRAEEKVAEVSNLTISGPNEELFDELTQALDMELTYDVDATIEKNRAYPTELIYNIKAKEVDKMNAGNRFVDKMRKGCRSLDKTNGGYRLELRILPKTILNEETQKKDKIATGLHEFHYVVDPDATAPQMTPKLAEAWNSNMPTLTVEFLGARVRPKKGTPATPLDEKRDLNMESNLQKHESLPDEAPAGGIANEDEAAPVEEQELLQTEDGQD